MTGLDDDHRTPLTTSNKHYWLFAFAWRWQDRWTREAHRDFWEAALPLWPRSRGNRPNMQTLAWHVASLRMLGHSDPDIAEALGYPLDTLRRKGILARADTLLADQEAGGPPAPPLPRIWSFDAGDPEPSQHGYLNVRSDLERWGLTERARQRGEPIAAVPTHALDANAPQALIDRNATQAADDAAERGLRRLQGGGDTSEGAK